MIGVSVREQADSREHGAHHRSNTTGPVHETRWQKRLPEADRELLNTVVSSLGARSPPRDEPLVEAVRDIGGEAVNPDISMYQPGGRGLRGGLVGAGGSRTREPAVG